MVISIETKDIALNGKTHNPTTRIIISACLLGEPTRYDGEHMKCNHPKLEQWHREGRIIAFCPEVAGGLPTPRTTAEIIGGQGLNVLDGESKVLDMNGNDVTEPYKHGAQEALRVAQANGVRLAILKANSPSCGNKLIYDGTFSVKLKPGKGVTAANLERNGIRVFNEEEIEEADLYLSKIDP
jgi:uncharacterized protein YbbK (DUF523 family)